MPYLFLPLSIFLFGLIIGSFLNCVIYRFALQSFAEQNLGGQEKEKGFTKGRSYCPNCKHKLAFWDLIPILSFVILRGKCRYCQQKISLQYPLVEITTAILFLLIFYYTKYDILYTIYGLIIASFLIIIFVFDLKHYIILDKIIYPAIGIAFFYQLLEIWNFGNWNISETWNLVFAIIPSLFFLAIILFSRGQWMGLGDFKLAILMGLFLGWPYVLIAFFFAFFIGATVGVGLIIFKKKTMKSEVPFAPFLIIGTFLAMFFGSQIITWLFPLLLLK